MQGAVHRRGANYPLRLHAPLGKVLYELAVQFHTIHIGWADNQEGIRMECDSRGESLDPWLKRQLRMSSNDLRRVCEVYKKTGKLALSQVCDMWNDTMNNLLANEVI